MSSAIKNYYKILRVDPSAEDEIITAAYRRLALMYHPDVNHTPEATAYFQEINEAYDVLHDPVKRRGYDWEQAAQASAQRPPDDATGYQEPPQQAAPSHEDTTSTGQDTYDEDDTHAGEESAHGQETEDEPEPAYQPENIEKVYRMPDANVWSMVIVLITLLCFLIPFLNMLISESGANTALPPASVLPTTPSYPSAPTSVDERSCFPPLMPFGLVHQTFSEFSGQLQRAGHSPRTDFMATG